MTLRRDFDDEDDLFGNKLEVQIETVKLIVLLLEVREIVKDISKLLIEVQKLLSKVMVFDLHLFILSSLEVWHLKLFNPYWVRIF